MQPKQSVTSCANLASRLPQSCTTLAVPDVFQVTSILIRYPLHSLPLSRHGGLHLKCCRSRPSFHRCWCCWSRRKCHHWSCRRTAGASCGPGPLWELTSPALEVHCPIIAANTLRVHTGCTYSVLGACVMSQCYRAQLYMPAPLAIYARVHMTDPVLIQVISAGMSTVA